MNNVCVYSHSQRAQKHTNLLRRDLFIFFVVVTLFVGEVAKLLESLLSYSLLIVLIIEHGQWAQW